MHAPYICQPKIWAISLEFCRKPFILEADNFLGACCRKAMTPKKLWTLPFPQHQRKISDMSLDSLPTQRPKTSPKCDAQVCISLGGLSQGVHEDLADSKICQLTAHVCQLPANGP